MCTLGNNEGDAVGSASDTPASSWRMCSHRKKQMKPVSQAESKFQNRFSGAVGCNCSALLILDSLDSNSQLHSHLFLCARLNCSFLS